MSWLISGGCGFLGTSLIERILKVDTAAGIRIIDDLCVGRRADLATVCEFVERDPESLDSPAAAGGPVELVIGDIRDFGLVQRAAQGAHAVVHLAASTGVLPSIENPRKDLEVNVIGTFNLLEAARQSSVERFIFASSGAPLGECSPPVHEGLPARPISPYGASKLAGEGYCSAYNGSFGVNTVALRFGNVYGPGSNHKTSVVATFIKQALAGETLVIYGDGDQTRDFIFIEDLIDAVVGAVDADVGGEVFQIASQRETTINELATLLCETILEVTGIDPAMRRIAPRRGEMRRNYSDISKVKAALGWQPKWNLRDGLRATVEWFIDALGESRIPQSANARPIRDDKHHRTPSAEPT